MKKFLVLGVLLFTPFFASAADFATQSIFLSKSSVTEGDTVLIHVVVNNDTSSSFTGKLLLKDEGGTIGTLPVSLTPGEADTFSMSWKPTQGIHSVTANLDDNSGNLVQSESASFTISPKPQPATALGTPPITPIDSSAPIEQAIANVSPAAAQATAPVFSAIDTGRVAAAGALDSGITYAKKQIGLPSSGGQVLGAETSQSPSGAWGTVMMIIMTVVLYVLSILRYIVGNVGAFYPVLAILFLFILWRLLRRYRRPRY